MSAPDTSAATSAAPVPGLSMLSSAAQTSMSSLISTGSAYIDRFFPPHKREAWKQWLVKFCTENPRIASFLLSQLALSGPPLALFILMTITVVIFALLAGILVGLIGALLFIVFAVGVALLFLLPVLFFTTAAAVFFWLWGMGTYYIVKWFNEKDVPGIHTSVKEGAMQASGMRDLPGLNGDSLTGERDAIAGEGEAPPEKGERPKAEKKAEGEGRSTGAQHHTDGKEKSERTSKKTGGGANGNAKGAGGAPKKLDVDS